MHYAITPRAFVRSSLPPSSSSSSSFRFRNFFSSNDYLSFSPPPPHICPTGRLRGCGTLTRAVQLHAIAIGAPKATCTSSRSTGPSIVDIGYETERFITPDTRVRRKLPSPRVGRRQYVRCDRRVPVEITKNTVLLSIARRTSHPSEHTA